MTYKAPDGTIISNAMFKALNMKPSNRPKCNRHYDLKKIRNRMKSKHARKARKISRGNFGGDSRPNIYCWFLNNECGKSERWLLHSFLCDIVEHLGEPYKHIVIRRAKKKGLYDIEAYSDNDDHAVELREHRNITADKVNERLWWFAKGWQFADDYVEWLNTGSAEVLQNYNQPKLV